MVHGHKMFHTKRNIRQASNSIQNWQRLCHIGITKMSLAQKAAKCLTAQVVDYFC